MLAEETGVDQVEVVEIDLAVVVEIAEAVAGLGALAQAAGIEAQVIIEVEPLARLSLRFGSAARWSFRRGRRANQIGLADAERIVARENQI